MKEHMDTTITSTSVSLIYRSFSLVLIRWHQKQAKVAHGNQSHKQLQCQDHKLRIFKCLAESFIMIIQ